VRTPAALNAHFAATGRDAVLVPMQVRPEDLAELVGSLRRVENLGGIVVTVPHKEAIAALCDTLTEAARIVGAVNVIRRERGCAPHRRAVRRRGLLRWPGGGWPRIARAPRVDGGRGWRRGRHRLCAAAPWRGGADRAQPHAGACAGRWSRAWPRRCRARASRRGGPDPAGHDIVVNATSLGLKPDDALPVDPALLQAGMLVAEVVMQPDVTALLEAAAARGCRTHRGLHMLTAQIPILADFVAAEGNTA
jgi:shikimate dehydrogenase